MTEERAGDRDGYPTGQHARVHQRFTEPVLTVMMDGAPHRTVDWSFGGMTVEGYEGRLAAGDHAEIIILLPEMTPDRLPAEVRIVRVDAAGRLTFTLEGVPSEGIDLLSDVRMATIAQIAEQDDQAWLFPPLSSA